MLFQTLLLFLITLVWQVSVHTAGAAGLVTSACLLVGPGAMLSIGLAPMATGEAFVVLTLAEPPLNRPGKQTEYRSAPASRR